MSPRQRLNRMRDWNKTPAGRYGGPTRSRRRFSAAAKPPAKRASMTTSAPVTIRANAISKVYGDFVAVRDLSFEVRKGTVAAFLGPNGAGKSTTMKMLTGYLAPSSGSVELLGKNP